MRTWLCCLLLGGCNWAFGITEQPPLPPDAPPPPTGRWASVSAGAAHVCAIDVDMHAYCWGDDRHGQLGLGAGVATLVPKSLGTATWLAIAAGARHSCGIQSDGTPWCWGDDDASETTGASTGSDVVFPKKVAVPIGTTFDSIGVGQQHTCAIGTGQIYCWGDPTTNGTGSLATTPALVKAPTSWTSLSVGFDHTCAIDTTNAVSCWGNDGYGQLGAPAGPLPQSVVGLPSSAIAVSAGKQFTCALIATTPKASTGQIWCWGSNDGSVLGTNLGQMPMQIIAGEDWEGIATGNVFACGLRGGMATCWGTASAGGFGDGMWSETVAPAAASVAFRADAISIARGDDGEENHCAIAGNDLTCWGDNRGGELGVPATLAEKAVVVASPGRPWKSVAVGLRHTCARDMDNMTFCWGADDLGQVSGMAGLGASAPCTVASCDEPTPTAAPQPVTSGEVVAGGDFTCARNATELDCWGTNADGELGTITQSAHRTSRSIAADATLIGGGHAACDVGTATKLECWGVINGVPVPTPTVVDDPALALAKIYAVAFGDNAQCALVDNNRACWGLNYHGEFGNASTVMQPGVATKPALIGDTFVYNAISLSSQHACAVALSGALDCWGTDYSHESGDSTPPASQKDLGPHTVTGLSSCTKVSTSYDVSCAICAGRVSCWGFLADGRLGRDMESMTIDANPAPVVMPPGPSTWIDLGTGGSHSCAVSADGTLACWGFGIHGQLGDGSHGSNLPVPIATP